MSYKQRKYRNRSVRVRKAGISNIKKGARDEYTGNLINKKGGVGNISEYVSNASSNSTPYLLSTRNRFVLLSKNRGRIVDRAIGETRFIADEAMKDIAKKLKGTEDAAIQNMISELGLSMDTESFIDLLNEARKGALTLKNDINNSLEQLRKASDNFISNSTSQTDFIGSNINFVQKGDQAIIEGIKKNIGRREVKNGNEMFNSLTNLLNILNQPEILEGDIRRLSNGMSLAYSAMSPARDESGAIIAGNHLFSPNQAKQLQSLFSQTQSNINKTLDNNGVVKLYKGKTKAGFLGDALATNHLNAFLNDLISAPESVEMSRKIDLEELLYEGFNSGSSKIDLDATMKANNNNYSKLLVSNNFKESRANFTADEAVKRYHLSFDFDFADGFKEIISKSHSNSIMMLYRAMVLNVAVNSGYYLEPKEKSFLVYNYLASSKGFGKQFELEGGKYPALINVNGKLHRFSTVIESMSLADLDESSIKGSVELGAPFTYSNPSPQMLYKQKLIAGRPNRFYRTAGFADKVDGMKSLVSDIESTYFSKQKNNRVLFRFKQQ